MIASLRYYFQNLLEVVHDLFEEQTSLEKVILKIMQRAQRLLKCEKAAVLLLDENSGSGQVRSTPDLRNHPQPRII
jgi:dual 3',5'-cyclic-AMP and -GMP phosphodiesterase 11